MFELLIKALDLCLKMFKFSQLTIAPLALILTLNTFLSTETLPQHLIMPTFCGKTPVQRQQQKHQDVYRLFSAVLIVEVEQVLALCAKILNNNNKVACPQTNKYLFKVSKLRLIYVLCAGGVFAEITHVSKIIVNQNESEISKISPCTYVYLNMYLENISISQEHRIICKSDRKSIWKHD